MPIPLVTTPFRAWLAGTANLGFSPELHICIGDRNLLPASFHSFIDHPYTHIPYTLHLFFKKILLSSPLLT